ncbi:MAG TPA: alanyl-tRNA synthetase [Chitinophagales bacterium]|nr:alanyl-tRNA synthetase [Chitinophagales bacterium]MCB9075412.1 hypothetical protein [Chitinophagales bacterium]HMU98776.1 alanyl-tRNA synthetase [Chitinophagales bacterium]HMV02210.1 alanyl-tRNA synthetase [Chitinophagales bacterium]HMW93337.1 alanyl-tRNA synthetase [Chitinophagales bacterium]
MENLPNEDSNKSKISSYIKKIGVLGFLFFLVKGLIWIAIFVFGVKGCGWVS